MVKEKSVTKKDIEQLLDGQTKVILKAVDKKVDKKIDGVVKIMLDAFQSNQEYMDKKFDAADKRFDQVVTEINKTNLNAVDVVRKEEFDKLENRVVKVEETVNLRLKKA